MPARVATIEYDPNRNARIALLNYADGEKRYILAPVGVKVGDRLESGRAPRSDPAMLFPCGTFLPARTFMPSRCVRWGRKARPDPPAPRCS